MSAAMVVGMVKKTLIALIASAFAAGGLAYAVPETMAAAVQSPDIVTVQPGDVQLIGRTNVHSGGRAGGVARPRRGSNSPGERTSGWH